MLDATTAGRVIMPFQANVQSYGDLALKFIVGKNQVQAMIKVVQPPSAPKN